MTRKTISGLPEALTVQEAALLEIEQGGQSRKITLTTLALALLPGGIPDLGPINAQMDDIAAVQAQLQDTYGSTVSAATNAALAQQAREGAVAARGLVESIASGAEAARQSAESASDFAAQYRTQALDLKNLAAASASAAGASAEAAAGSASTASSVVSDAEQYAASASASANTATIQADAAGSYATAAASSASTALAHRDAAGVSAGAAQQSAIQASASKDAASGSATAAATSATNAGASSTSAGNAASAAAASALTASTAAGDASSSATAANASAVNASNAGSAASQSATLAAQYRDAAQSYASSSSSSAAAASGSAASAATSATISAGFATDAIGNNPNFALWSSETQLLNWSDWEWGPGHSFQRVVTETGAYAFRETVTTAHGHGGLYQQGGSSLNVNPGYTRVVPGYYVIEAKVILVAGTLVGSGVLVYASADSFNTVTGTAMISFGSEVGAGTIGREYYFTKFVDFNVNMNNLLLYAMTQWGNYGPPANKTVEWRRCLIRRATDAEIASKVALPALEATVSQQASVLASVDGKTQAYLSQRAVAGNASATVEILAITTPGGAATSNVNIMAKEVLLSNGQVALRLVGNRVTVSGDLDVGGAIRIGGQRLAIAIQPFQVSLADGESYTYPVPFTTIPARTYDLKDLSPLSSGQSYDVRPINDTVTGFTMRAKKLVPGTPTAASSGAGFAVGAGPQWQANKAAGDAYNGSYTYSFTIRSAFTGEPGFYESSYSVSLYIFTNGGWAQVGMQEFSWTNSSAGFFNRSMSAQVVNSAVIGTGNNKFGISVNDTYGYSPTIQAFSGVSWLTSAGASGEVTASPNGEKVIVTIQPQNVS